MVPLGAKGGPGRGHKKGNKKEGYDLSQRCPGAGAKKHKYVQDEADIDPAVKEYFFDTVMKTRTPGLRRSNGEDALVCVSADARVGH